MLEGSTTMHGVGEAQCGDLIVIADGEREAQPCMTLARLEGVGGNGAGGCREPQ